LNEDEEFGRDDGSKKFIPKEVKEKKMMKNEMMKQFFKDNQFDEDIINDFTTTPIRELTGH